jgi:hypothetical protein
VGEVAVQKGESVKPAGRLSALASSLTLLRLGQAFLLGLCVLAGYLVAGWWWGTRDTTPLARICARVDYINGLQDELQEQQAASQEVRDEFKALVEECRSALINRAEESD